MQTFRFPASAVLIVALLASAACSQPPRTPEQEAADIGRRVGEICSMPAGERAAEIERLKKEAGITVFCPND